MRGRMSPGSVPPRADATLATGAWRRIARGSLLAYGYLDQPTAPGQLSAADTHARLLAASPAYAARKSS